MECCCTRLSANECQIVTNSDGFGIARGVRRFAIKTAAPVCESFHVVLCYYVCVESSFGANDPSGENYARAVLLLVKSKKGLSDNVSLVLVFLYLWKQ